MKTIRVYKMISGEEVLGMQVEENDSTYTIENPASIMMQQQPDGRVGVGLAPFMPYASEKTVIVNKMAVCASANPATEMQNEYNRIFGSGIQIVGAGAIKGM